MRYQTAASRFPLAPFLLCSVLACGQGKLTYSAAEQSVRHHPALPKDVAVEVQGIAQGDDAPEATVRAKIAGSVLNLKFRRFDTGWTWESVETNGGAWIDAATAVEQLREEERRKNALGWAQQHIDEYARTAEAMNWYLDSLPSTTKMSMQRGWFDMREFSIRAAKFGNWTEEQRRERIRRFSEAAIDAWGNEILVAFDDARQAATFVSLGPDKTKGTADDLLVAAVGAKQWSQEDERLIWEYSRTWRLPEGLEGTIAKYREEGDRIEHSRMK